MADPMPWWGTIALVLSLAALGVTAALAFAFADRCDSLQRQVRELRGVVDSLIDQRITPLTFTSEGGWSDES